MSKRKNKDKKVIFWIIVGFMLLSSGALDFIAGLLGLAAVFVGLAFFIALIVVFVKKMTKNNSSSYSNVKKTNNGTTSNRQNANQYSKKVTIDAASGQQVVVTKSVTPPFKDAPAPKPDVAPAKPVVVTDAEKPKKRTTGDPEIDKMIEEKDRAIKEMHRLNKNIEDPKLSEQIDRLEDITDKIVDYVAAHPKKKKDVTKFVNFYLPTTLKLLNSYDRMDDVGISGTNIDGTKEKVEGMMDTALTAFERQLDALFAEEALDVSTDIAVMANMLRAEGLTDDELMKEAVEAAKTLSGDKDNTEDIFAGLDTSDPFAEYRTSN